MCAVAAGYLCVVPSPHGRLQAPVAAVRDLVPNWHLWRHHRRHADARREPRLDGQHWIAGNIASTRARALRGRTHALPPGAHVQSAPARGFLLSAGACASTQVAFAMGFWMIFLCPGSAPSHPRFPACTHARTCVRAGVGAPHHFAAGKHRLSVGHGAAYD
jgi:hypothetical protein